MIVFIFISLIVAVVSLTPAPTVNKSPMPTTIRNMEGYSLDSTGKIYYEYNGKRIDAESGTTIKETSGGYINTKDGTFIPNIGEINEGNK